EIAREWVHVVEWRPRGTGLYSHRKQSGQRGHARERVLVAEEAIGLRAITNRRMRATRFGRSGLEQRGDPGVGLRDRVIFRLGREALRPRAGFDDARQRTGVLDLIEPLDHLIQV